MRSQNCSPAQQVLSFLIRSWSEDNTAKLKFIKMQGGCADVQGRVVMLGDYYDQNIMPDVKDIARWRLWRWIAFHEACHLKWTPRLAKSDMVMDVIRHLPKDLFDNEPFRVFTNKVGLTTLATRVFEIVEDAIVNRKGVEEWRGMSEEFDATRDPCVKNVERNVLAVEPPNTPAYFFTVLILWALANKRDPYALKPELIPPLKEITEIIDSASDDRREACIKIFRVLSRCFQHFDLPPPQDPDGDGSAEASANLKKAPSKLEDMAKLNLSEDDLERLKEKVSKELADEFEGLKEEEKAELEQALFEKDFDRQFSTVQTDIPEPSDDWSFTDNDKQIEQRLLTRLQKWKVGWAERLGKEGYEVDVEEYVIDKLSPVADRTGNIFYDERRASPRGTLDILWDISGSTSPDSTLYKRAVMVIGNVLDKLKVKFAVYAFQNVGNRPVLSLIKEPRAKWGNVERGRVASVSHDGGTPLSDILSELGPLLLKSGRKRLVIMTDGQPESMSATARVIADLESKGLAIYLMGVGREICKDHCRRRFYELKGGRNSGQITFVPDIDDIPDNFFKLIAPRG